MTLTTRPDVEIGELPDLDAEPLCEYELAPCPAAARWRLTLRCSACGDPASALLCKVHKIIVAWALPLLRSKCCAAPPADVQWRLL